MIPRILNFFADTKRGNKWNSTKDTAMILYAMCDYLHTQAVVEGQSNEILISVGNWKKRVSLSSTERMSIKVPASALSIGRNELKFSGNVRGAMHRTVLTTYLRGSEIKPFSAGIEVEREFYLLDENGKSVRALKSGETIERGAYIESVVRAKHRDSNMSYVLVESPKPAGSEILPDSDSRFKRTSTHHALREDKTFGVAWHHERTGREIVDRSVFHVELEGTYMVPPAHVELMYNTLVRGSSDGFELVVEH
jgi:uncharacterized protein YfaS (alpha-2-macroglobulin family)